MTGPARDVRADAIRAFARRLAHEGCRVPGLLARELIVLLDSHQIGLVDLRRPTHPDAQPLIRPTDPIPAAAPAPPPGLDAYRTARQAQKEQP